MANDDRDILEVLKFELKFLEKGGYGRSPRTPWRPQLIFEDSPTCMNYDAPERRGDCHGCLLMRFVPPERLGEKIPCRHIPLNAQGETVDSLYRWGDQQDLEEAVGNWLRAKINTIETARAHAKRELATFANEA